MDRIRGGSYGPRLVVLATRRQDAYGAAGWCHLRPRLAPPSVGTGACLALPNRYPCSPVDALASASTSRRPASCCGCCLRRVRMATGTAQPPNTAACPRGLNAWATSCSPPGEWMRPEAQILIKRRLIMFAFVKDLLRRLRSAFSCFLESEGTIMTYPYLPTEAPPITRIKQIADAQPGRERKKS